VLRRSVHHVNHFSFSLEIFNYFTEGDRSTHLDDKTINGLS